LIVSINTIINIKLPLAVLGTLVGVNCHLYSEMPVSRYQISLFTFIYRYTNEKYLAEDITQDTFIKAYEKTSLFKGKTQFKTWLFRIAYR
jgi:hypothetical protein